MNRRLPLVVAALSLLLSPLSTLGAQAATVKAGAKCSKAGQIIHMNAMIYTCLKSGKKLVWSKGVKENPGPSNSGNGQNGGPTQQQNAPSDKEFLYMKRIGMSCSTNGVFGFTGGSLAICKNNVVKYALPADVPGMPAGGYTSRPSWYPTLAQQLGKTSEPTCKPSSISFTSPVIPLDQLAPSVPYGAMIGGHVTPIDHAYLGLKPLYKDPATRTDADYVPISAPADGVITSISNLGSPTSIRVVMEHGCNVATVYMVINKLSGVLASYASEFATNGANRQVSIPIKAGQEFARQRDNAMDFNVWDGTQWLSGFANPLSYITGDAWKPYTADPLPFFTPTIRSAMEAVMQHSAAPRFGKIDWDVIGAAAGNWYLDGTFGYGGHLLTEFQNATSDIPGGQVNGKNDYSWSHLAIAPHEVDSTKWIFSTGWWSDPAGDPHQMMLTIDGSKPTPDKLTAANGLVAYQLTSFVPNEPAGTPARIPGTTAPFAVGYTLGTGFPQGVVGLQVNSDGSLSVEINTAITDSAKFTGFTSAKRTYRR